jgi:hypothetical protein
MEYWLEVFSGEKNDFGYVEEDGDGGYYEQGDGAAAKRESLLVDDARVWLSRVTYRISGRENQRSLP